MHFLFLLAISAIEGIGILTSGFIVAVNLLDLAKHRGMNICDVILVTRATACICYHCAHVGEVYTDMLRSDDPGMDYVTLFLRTFTLFLCSSVSWCASWLCVFYCVKIVDFKHPLFLWLKLRISKAVPWLLIGSGLGSLTISIASGWKSYENILQSQNNLTGNYTAMTAEGIGFGFEHILHWLLLLCFPILVGMVSIILILTSLCRHTQRMKDNASGFSQPRLEVHFAAAKIVGAFLLLNTLLLLSECVDFMLDVFWWDDILEIVMTTITPSQTVILILGNSKLKEALRKILSFAGIRNFTR